MQDHEHSVVDPGHTHPYDDTYHDVQERVNYGGDGYLYHSPGTLNKTTSSHTTGLTVTGVSSSYRHGDETRPKNMNVVYIIRVF